MLPRERSAHNDALQRLRHVEPGTSNGRIERHDPMGKEPPGDLIGAVPSQIIPHQDHADRGIDATWWVPKPGFPSSQRRASFIHQNHWMLPGPLQEHGFQLRFEPGMQDGVGAGAHTFGSHLTGSWPKERQQFGCSVADILMWLELWVAFWRPGGSRLRQSLVGAGLILTP